MIHSVEHFFQTSSTITIIWVLLLIILFVIPMIMYPIALLAASLTGGLKWLPTLLPANKRKRKWQNYASEEFDRKVELWRERAAIARQNLPPGASGDEVMAQAEPK
ncbi:MAG: hypothetical protein ACRDK7_02015 [Solirubrobacteraceae bacterium]